MAFEHDNFAANIEVASGGDAALRAELRTAFCESLAQHLDMLGRSRCDANWRVAALRLRGLGASFHAKLLVDLAEEALDGAPGDPVVLRKLGTLHDDLTSN